MFAPALAEATAVAEAEADGAGVGDWPNALKASAIEHKQVKIVDFIGLFESVMRPGPILDSKKYRG